VLDVGCGEAWLADHLDPSITYTGIDLHAAVARNIQASIRVGDALTILRQGGHWATVVCLEFLEHVDPANQRELIQSMWRCAGRRLIISTPSPDALARYPRTDHFYGVGNPHHTREVDEWWFRDAVADVCQGVAGVTILHHGLDGDDYPTWLQGPAAGWMGIVDRG
jgi:hypothetical protein